MALRPSLVAAFTLWPLSAWGAQISIPDSTVQAGMGVAANILFAGQGSQVAGLQFDLVFDPSLTITAAGGAVSADAGKNLSTADLDSGTRRLIIVGLNQNTISDGVVLSLEIIVPAGSSGTQYSLHVSNARATDPHGNAVSLAGVDGAIAVDGAPSQILGVVNGASFLPGIVDGAWISILGTNLSASTRNWQPDQIVNGNLPTSLGGVSVTIDGLPAAISYVSSTQLNVQAPATGKIGPVAVVVNNGVGDSATASVAMARNSPGVFVFSQAGGRYAAAVIVRSDGGVDYLGPTGLFGTAPATRPARPGEIVELYATGLGPTNPAVPTGRVFSGAAPTVDLATVSIGGVNAAVGFAGISSAGLYQLNVTVPDVTAGDQPLIVSVNGIRSQPGVFVSVGQ